MLNWLEGLTDTDRGIVLLLAMAVVGGLALAALILLAIHLAQ
jgi:hypothetical protein